MRDFAKTGSNGISAIVIPNGTVNSPLRSIAPNAYNNSTPVSKFLLGGAEGKLNLNTLSMPNAFNCKMAGAKSERCISGGVASNSSLYAFSVYNLRKKINQIFVI